MQTKLAATKARDTMPAGTTDSWVASSQIASAPATSKVSVHRNSSPLVYGEASMSVARIRFPLL